MGRLSAVLQIKAQTTLTLTTPHFKSVCDDTSCSKSSRFMYRHYQILFSFKASNYLELGIQQGT